MKISELAIIIVLVVGAFLVASTLPVEAALGFGREGTAIERQVQPDDSTVIEPDHEFDQGTIDQGAIIAYRKDQHGARILASIEDCKIFIASNLKHRSEYVFLVSEESLAIELRDNLEMWELEKVTFLQDIPDDVFEAVRPVLGDKVIAVKGKYYDPSIPRLNFLQKFMKEVSKFSGILGVIPGLSWGGNWSSLGRLFN